MSPTGFPLLLVLAELQAGGGGGFGGGGGGFGGGGGGDGEGIAYLIYFLIRFAIEYPPLGVPLLILVVVTAIVGSRRGWWKHQERTIRKTRPARQARASANFADVLRASDPDFVERRFLKRVETAFRKAQSSWCEQDLEPLRPFVSDGVFERFSLQIEEQQQDGWRQGMEGISLGPLEIVHVETGQHFETVTVRIPFNADIHRVGLEDGKRISGSKLPRNWFTECWSFLRRRGAKSISGEGLMEGKCPNCAAALTMNQSARCTYCECLARSGEFDWVLAEITQASEWRAESEQAITGLNRYAEHDPGMNVQLLEDRASVAFWRRCAADRAGEIAPLTRVADESLCRRYAEQWGMAESGERSYLADCAVGSVRTLGILAGKERDRALVEVLYDGRVARVAGDQKRRLATNRSLRRTIFVFARKAGTQTRLADTFTTAHCRTCGAHDTGGTDPACPYCGSPRTGDRSTWLVTEILASSSTEAASLRAELEASAETRELEERMAPVGRSAAELVSWAAALVQADGVVDAQERQAMHALARHGDVPPERVDELLDTPDNSESVSRPRDEREARAWLQALIEISLADGKLEKSERRFLIRAGELLGVGHRALEHDLRTARAALYRESRQARRGASA